MLPQSVTHLPGERIESRSAAGELRFAYQFGPALPKPTIHPLTTAGGVALTAFQPSDHVWHRGVWFTIKYINAANFWEENAPYGVQRTIAEPTIASPTQISAESNVTQINHHLRWTSEATGPVFEEVRELKFESCDDGSGVIDWCSTLTSQADLRLDRTPFTNWGGYSGFTFRGSNALRDVRYVLPDGTIATKIVGDRHSHVVMQANASGTHPVSIAMIDHPANPRSPSPWYCRSDPNYAFVNAAFLFHEPMQIATGQVVHFRYRLAYCDGNFESQSLDRLLTSFATT